MVSPSYKDRICAMFDSFSKTTSRNYYRDLLRAEKRRNKRHQEEPVEYLLELLGHRDAYPSDFFVLYVDGHSCVVESETLYKELTSLPDKQRTVLLPDFWRNFTDEEISFPQQPLFQILFFSCKPSLNASPTLSVTL